MTTIPRPILKTSKTSSSNSRSPNNPHQSSSRGSSSSGNNNASKPRLPTERVPPNFRVDYRYTNALPDPPSDAKFLPYPFPSDYLYGYTHTTLEKSYKYRLHMQPSVPLSADVVDPFGCEDWTRLAEQDEKDRQLLRKDGPEVSVGGRVEKSRLEGAEYKPWLQKTIYTAPSIHDTEHHRTEEQMQQDEDDLRRSDSDFIEKEFEASAKLILKPPRPGLVLKRSSQLIPTSAKHPHLKGLVVYMVRFDPREKITEDSNTMMDDSQASNQQDDLRVSKSILARRVVPPPKRGPIAGRLPPKNPFSPVALVLPVAETQSAQQQKSSKDKDGEEDDDIFGDDEEGEIEGKNAKTSNQETTITYSKTTGALMRDYGVEVIKEQGQRALLSFDKENKYVEMIPVDQFSLRCSRIKTIDGGSRDQGSVELLAREPREGEEWAATE